MRIDRDDCNFTLFTGKTIFLADLANQGILNKFSEDKNVEITSLVKDFEGVSLLGPNSLAVAGNSSIFD